MDRRPLSHGCHYILVETGADVERAVRYNYTENQLIALAVREAGQLELPHKALADIAEMATDTDKSLLPSLAAGGARTRNRGQKRRGWRVHVGTGRTRE